MLTALYPGQGSQHIGMGKFLYDNFKQTRELFECASDTLKINFQKLCFEGDEETLDLTENAQPALLLVSIAYFQVLNQDLGIQFDAAMGHSLGEYSALVNAEVIEAEAAFLLVKARGQSMQKATPINSGGMLAVLGLTPDQCQKLCKWAESESGSQPMEPANFNSPDQIVISGKKEICDWLLKNSSNFSCNPSFKRMKLIPLKVSAPFHCSLMKPAEEEMIPLLENTKFKKAKYPIISNFSAKASQEADTLRQNIIHQITAPVRWLESAQELKNIGGSLCIELGTGQILAGLMKKIDPKAFKVLNINSIDDLGEVQKYV